jgi:hypothetical protein
MEDYNEQEEQSRLDMQAYTRIEDGLEIERLLEEDLSDTNPLVFSQKDSKTLAELAKTFTFSNTVGIDIEVQRYKTIADYFAKKCNRERYNITNSTYLGKMHEKLLKIGKEDLPEHVSSMCTKLLQRFNAGII